jgi:hypothetical protein
VLSGYKFKEAQEIVERLLGKLDAKGEKNE